MKKYFDFSDWKACFSTWGKHYSGKEETHCIVVSRHWASEGLWIEEVSTSLSVYDTRFSGKEDISKLEQLCKEGKII